MSAGWRSWGNIALVMALASSRHSALSQCCVCKSSTVGTACFHKGSSRTVMNAAEAHTADPAPLTEPPELQSHRKCSTAATLQVPKCSPAPLLKPPESPAPKGGAVAEPAPVSAVVAPKLKGLSDAAELPIAKDGAVPLLAVGGAAPPKEDTWLPAAELLAPALNAAWLPAAELPAPKEKTWLPLALPKPNIGAPADEPASAPKDAWLPAEALLPPPKESAGLLGAALAVPKLNGRLLNAGKEVGLLA